MNASNKPALRFKGFNDEWEGKKVSEIVGNVIGGGTPKTNIDEYWNGDIPWLQSSNLKEDEMFSFDIHKNISKLGLDNSATKLVPKNSIAVVTRVGVGKLVFVPFSYTTSQDFTSLCEIKTDISFTCYSLYLCIKNDLNNVQGSAIKGITKEDLLSKMLIIPPTTPEQEKIGTFFKQLDRLISLHQTKYDKLINIKKSLLEKMFPQHGNSTPTLRFKGFYDEWKECKLGEVVLISSGFMGNSLLNDGEYRLTRIETIANGFVDESKVGFSNEKPDISFLLKKGDILYSNINSISHMGKVAQYQGNSILYHGINLLRLSPNYGIDSNFILQMLNTEEKRNWAKSHANQAVSQASINQSLLCSQNIFVCSFPEQEKIGKFFQTFDHMLSLTEQKLEMLKNIKKACLEKMFV